jgi:hypothetical protein
MYLNGCRYNERLNTKKEGKKEIDGDESHFYFDENKKFMVLLNLTGL